jgi:hypothetical protein
MLIKEYCKLHGITQKEFGRWCGTGYKQEVNDWIKAGWRVYGDDLVSPRRKINKERG